MERAKMKWIKQARFKTNQLELIGFLKTLTRQKNIKQEVNVLARYAQSSNRFYQNKLLQAKKNETIKLTCAQSQELFPLDTLENDFTASEKPSFLDTLTTLSIFQLFMEVQVYIFAKCFSLQNGSGKLS